MSRTDIRSWIALLMLPMLGVASGVGAEPTSTIVDAPNEGAEAREVRIVLGSGGSVVRVVGEGCPSCPSTSFLPTSDFSVEVFGEEKALDTVQQFNGSPGTIHYIKSNGMTYRVNYTPVQVEEAQE